MKRHTDHLLDAYWVRAAVNGDSQAFKRLLIRWHPRLVAYANSQLFDAELAKDAVQETLIFLSQYLDTLDDPQAFAKWVYTILHRRCVDQLRVLHRPPRETIAIEDDKTANDLDVQRDLKRCIDRLNPTHAQVIRLFYFEGFSAAEMSEILGVPSGTVKSRLFKARQTIKNFMEIEHD